MKKESERSLDPDFWVISDRVLFVSSNESSERPAALGVRGAYVDRVETAQALRSGPALQRAQTRAIPLYELGSAPVVPGFVNAHTHLAMAPLRGVTDLLSRKGNVISDVYFRMESHLNAEDVRAFARLGAYESLLSGVTEVWDHYYFAEQVAEALVEVGLSGVVAPTLQDLSGPWAHRSLEELESTLTIAHSAKFAAAGVRAALGPHATDTVSDGLLRRVGQLALQENLWVHLHAAQTWTEFEKGRTESSHGIGHRLLTSLPDARVLLAHGLFLTEQECRSLAQSSYVLAYCPYSQLQFGVLSPFGAWRRSGGAWALGTDCVASNDALNVQRELPLAAGDGALRAGFSRARERLLWGDGGGARALEQLRGSLIGEAPVAPDRLLPSAVGCGLGCQAALSAGSPANFLVLDPDHPALFPSDDLARTMAYGCTQGAIRWICVRGRICGLRDGLQRELLSSEAYRESLLEARRRRRDLIARAQLDSVPCSV